MIRKLKSGNGGTLEEVVISVIIAALAAFMLASALSVFSLPDKPGENKKDGTVRATFEIGEANYSIDIDVTFEDGGYTYAK